MTNLSKESSSGCLIRRSLQMVHTTENRVLLKSAFSRSNCDLSGSCIDNFLLVVVNITLLPANVNEFSVRLLCHKDMYRLQCRLLYIVTYPIWCRSSVATIELQQLHIMSIVVLQIVTIQLFLLQSKES